MYYDVVIRYADPSTPERHFWNGYERRSDAVCALPSVGRIIRDHSGLHSVNPVTFLDPETPLHGDEVRLARDGQPYCTVTVEEVADKRRDAGMRVQVAGGKIHTLRSHWGPKGSQTACGRELLVDQIRDVVGNFPPLHQCQRCYAIERDGRYYDNLTPGAALMSARR